MTDDRELTGNVDKAIGRLVVTNALGTGFGTAFIIDCPDATEKCHLSAGHNFSGLADPKESYVLEFDVPASKNNCDPNRPDPKLQFPVNKASVSMANGGPGNDWAVFRCGKSDKKTTFEKQADALDLTAAIPANGDATVTGFGRDNTPMDNAGGGNASCGVCAIPNGARHRVQQTHTATFTRQNGGVIDHDVDTCAGNSGSPIQDDDTDEVIGIHTNGGCDAPGVNKGTRIDLAALQAAITACKQAIVPVVPAANHYLCRKVKDLGIPAKHVKQTGIATVDQVGPDICATKKPFLLCSPLSVKGGPVSVPSPNLHYVCYKTKCGQKPAVSFDVTDQFGPLRLQTKKPFLLCNPSSKTLAP